MRKYHLTLVDLHNFTLISKIDTYHILTHKIENIYIIYIEREMLTNTFPKLGLTY